MVNSNGTANIHQQASANGNRYTPSKSCAQKAYNNGVNGGGLTEECVANEMRSRTVESLIQPIINQLNFLSVSSSSSFNSSNSSKNDTLDGVCNGNGANGSTKSTRKGRSKRAHTLVESLVEAIENFLRQGSELAHEYPEMRDDIMKVHYVYYYTFLKCFKI